MMTAIQEAAAIEAAVHPIDRDIRTTLARCWRLMGLKAKFSLLLDVMGAMDEADNITAEDVEALKDKDAPGNGPGGVGGNAAPGADRAH